MNKNAVFIGLTALSLGLAWSCAQRKSISSSPWQTNYKLDRPSAAVVSALRAGKEMRLLVVVKHDAEAMGLSDDVLDSASEEAITARVARFAELKQTVLSTAQSKKVPTEDTYSHLPIIKISARNLNDLLAVANDPSVVSISEDVQFKFNASANLNLIRQPEAMLTGFGGAGTSVAVLDTGLDYKRAAFGPCTAPATPAETCRVVHVQDFARADNMLDDSVLHGTNVAGIVGLVAPGTKLIGLDVFDGEGAYTSDIVNAINWVIANKTKYNIAAMNMSFGSSGFNNCTTGSMAAAIGSARNAGILSAVASGNSGAKTLDYPACSPYSLSVGAVYDTGIGTLDWGCGTKDVSAPDKLTCFSCVSNDLKMAAPGVRIVAAGITMSGTSQATPHVAGSLAVLKSAFPNDTPAQLQDRLTSTGKNIPLQGFPDAKVSRLDLAAALGPKCQFVVPAEIKTLDATVDVEFTTGSTCNWNLTSEASWIKVTSSASGQGPGKFTIAMDKPLSSERTGLVSMSGDGDKVSLKIIQPPDTEAPKGSFTINGSAGALYTTSRRVSLVMSVSDINELDTMCISNTPTCEQFIPFESQLAWDLSEGDGIKTVYLFLKDKVGNTTKSDQALTKTIILDTTPPSEGTLTAAASSLAERIQLNWSGFSDSGSPVESYVLVYSKTQMPASCTEGELVYNGNAVSQTHGPLSPGTYYYRVCAINGAKITSSGITASFTLSEIDKTPPTGSISINNNAPFIRTNTATLTIQAADGSGVSKMCISTSTSCSSWQTFATTKPISLSWTQGIKTVNIWFEDGKGNRNTSPFKDDIILDTINPTTGRIVATPMQQSIKVEWTAGTDTNGVASYRLVYRQGILAPRSGCIDGTSINLTPGILNATVANIAAKTYYGFRVCAIDRAGNVASGSTTFARTP